MQVKSIAECSKGEHSVILLTFIKLPFVIKIFVLSIFEWAVQGERPMEVSEQPVYLLNLTITFDGHFMGSQGYKA